MFTELVISWWRSICGWLLTFGVGYTLVVKGYIPLTFKKLHCVMMCRCGATLSSPSSCAQAGYFSSTKSTFSDLVFPVVYFRSHISGLVFPSVALSILCHCVTVTGCMRFSACFSECDHLNHVHASRRQRQAMYVSHLLTLAV